MFFNLMKGEWRKSFRLKGLIVFLIFMLLVFILSAVVTEVFQEVKIDDEDQLIIGQLLNPGDLSYIKTKEQAEGEIQYLKTQLAEYVALKYEDPKTYYTAPGSGYRIKAQIAAIQYVIDNNLYGQAVTMYQPQTGMFTNLMSGRGTGYDYIGFCMELMGIVVVIFIVVAAASTFANEFKSGTVKLLMIRPVSRSKMLSAKLAATAVAGIALYSAVFILATIYGAARYGFPVLPTVYVFNASGAFLSTAGLGVFLLYVQGALQVLTIGAFAFTLGLVCKNSTVGVVLPIIGVTGAASLLLGFLHIGNLPLSYQANLSQFFAVEATGQPESSFFLSIILLIVYWAIMMVINYTVYRKRDIV